MITGEHITDSEQAQVSAERQGSYAMKSVALELEKQNTVTAITESRNKGKFFKQLSVLCNQSYELMESVAKYAWYAVKWSKHKTMGMSFTPEQKKNIESIESEQLKKLMKITIEKGGFEKNKAKVDDEIESFLNEGSESAGIHISGGNNTIVMHGREIPKAA